MNNPGLPAPLWTELDGGLWHATSPAGLQGILADGAIRIVAGRYDNSLCRHLGGVSLMDFGSSAEHLDGQFENWHGWFGHQQGCRVPVWLEIDREAVAANLTDAARARTISRGNLSKRIIPGVEACHCGPLPVFAIRSALLIDRHNLATFHRCDVPWDGLGAMIDAFALSLPPPPPEHPLARALREIEERRGARPDAF